MPEKRAELTRRNFLRGAAASAALAFASACRSLPILEPEREHNFKIPKHGNLRVVFQFEPHKTEEQGKRIGEIFKKFKPDVVCLENAFGTEEINREIETANYLGTYWPTPNSNSSGQYSEIQKAGAPPIFILERISPEERKTGQGERQDYEELSNKGDELFFSGKPVTALAHYRESIKLRAKTQVDRERGIKKIISNFHSELIKRYPHLTYKPEIKVVVAYGSTHTPIYIHAKKVGIKAERKISKPTYFGPEETMMRRAAFGLPVKTNPDAIAQMSLARMLMSSIHLATGAGFDNSSAYAHIATKKAGFETFKRISKSLAEGIKLHDAMRDEDIEVPETKDELHRFLKKRAIPLAPAD